MKTGLVEVASVGMLEPKVMKYVKGSTEASVLMVPNASTYINARNVVNLGMGSIFAERKSRITQIMQLLQSQHKSLVNKRNEPMSKSASALAVKPVNLIIFNVSMNNFRC